MSLVFTQEYVRGCVIIVILLDLIGGKTLYRQFYLSLTLWWINSPTPRSTGLLLPILSSSPLPSFPLPSSESHHIGFSYCNTSALNTSTTTMCWWYLDKKHIDRNRARLIYYKHKDEIGDSRAWQIYLYTYIDCSIKTFSRYIAIGVHLSRNTLNKEKGGYSVRPAHTHQHCFLSVTGVF